MKCPIATQDIAVNLENRNRAFAKYAARKGEYENESREEDLEGDD